MQNLKNRISSQVLALSLLPFLSTGCAVLHHVQVGHIDNRNTKAQIPFEILMSEIGVSTGEIGKLGEMSNSQGGDAIQDAAAIVSLFQMGPRTGNLTYNARFAEKLVYEIYQKCPTGTVTGLVSVREMRKYPVISGEIVKVTGFCLKDRKEAPAVSQSISKENKGDI